MSQSKGKERTGKVLEVAVSLELVHKLFMKVRAYHKVRETLYFKVSYSLFILVVMGFPDLVLHYEIIIKVIWHLNMYV